jgi:hypothetical protein
MFRTLVPVLALTAGMAMTSGVAAQSIVTDTYTIQKEIPNTQTVNFAEFDIDNDGQLSRKEIGAKLFYIFDTDGNHVIDNKEYLKPMVLTIIPMQKEKIVTYDFNDDGIADKTQYKHKEFFEQSMLAKFDKDGNGLSASDFIERNFWSLDDNRDKVIDIKEWQAAYIKATSPSAANPNRYNR